MKFIPIFKAKLREFDEDQYEYTFIKALKFNLVVLDKLPSCWKCLTWKYDDEIFESYSGYYFYLKLFKLILNFFSDESDQKKEICKNDNFSQLYEKKEIDQIYLAINTLERELSSTKEEIYFYDVSISIMFNYFREYLKLLLQFQDALLDQNELEQEIELNEDSESINEQIIKIFSISNKVEFFSDSPDAYQIKLDNETTLKIQLKDTD